jgi:general secretion pathway protein C
MAVAKGARVVPAVKNGKPDGFKLYAIRPSSVYSKLGLTNGDTIQSINGFAQGILGWWWQRDANSRGPSS